MMRSLYSGVAGLKNHQTRMDVIGNNIANVNTVAFKSARAVFADVFSQQIRAASSGNQTGGAVAEGIQGGTNPTQVGLGVKLASIDLVFNSSAPQSTGKAEDLMISGDGFFIVDINGNRVGGLQYTRAGNFAMDNNGFLVTTEGYFVMGYKLAADATPLDAKFIWPGAADERITSAANNAYYDPAEAVIIAGNPSAGVKLSSAEIKELCEAAARGALQAISTGTNDAATIEAAANAAATAKATELGLDATTSAAVIVEAVPLVVDGFAAAAAELAGKDSGVDSALAKQAAREIAEMIYDGIEAGDIKDDIYDDIKAVLSAAPYTFDANVQQVMIDAAWNATAGNKEAAEAASKDPADVLVQINFNNFSSISFDQQGVAWGIRSDTGEKEPISKIALAMFMNNSGLEKLGGNLYSVTGSSGEPVYTVSGYSGSGQVMPGYLEMSNVDLANEFTDMIVTQRGFQANSRIITVRDTLLEELVNLKR
jgi:flagellar hook protein FlgE